MSTQRAQRGHQPEAARQPADPHVTAALDAFEARFREAIREPLRELVRLLAERGVIR